MQWLDITTRPDFQDNQTKKRERTPEGILRICEQMPDPETAYVVRPESGQVPRIVRSVGQCNGRFYYAADLRFLFYDGFRPVWPAVGTHAYPEFRLEMITDHASTIVRIIGTVKRLADQLHGCRECLLQIVKPGTGPETAEAATNDALCWCEKNSVKLKDMDTTPRRAEAIGQGLLYNIIQETDLNVEGGQP
jgi:hypothetical protein